MQHLLRRLRELLQGRDGHAARRHAIPPRPDRLHLLRDLLRRLIGKKESRKPLLAIPALEQDVYIDVLKTLKRIA